MKSSYCNNAIVVFAALVVLIAACFAGCGGEESTYQIEVRNRLPILAGVSLDGMKEQDVAAGGTLRFVDVSEGTHILRAEASGFEPIEETMEVARDIVWTIEER